MPRPSSTPRSNSSTCLGGSILESRNGSGFCPTFSLDPSRDHLSSYQNGRPQDGNSSCQHSPELQIRRRDVQENVCRVQVHSLASREVGLTLNSSVSLSPVVRPSLLRPPHRTMAACFTCSNNALLTQCTSSILMLNPSIGRGCSWIIWDVKQPFRVGLTRHL